LTVKIEISEGEKWKRSLKVEVPQEEVKSKFDRIYKTFKAEAKIPGFRPGKVPMATIKTRFSELAAKEVFEELMDESYKEAINQSGLHPIVQPEIKDVDFAEDKPLTYTAEFEVRPEIELEQSTGFDLKRPDDRVSGDEVKSMMEYIQRKHSELVIADRPAKEGDFAFVDLEVLSEETGKLEEKEFKNVQVELMKGDLGSQFLEHLDGKSAGDEVEFEVVYPPDHFDKRFAGNKVKYRAKVIAVKELHLAELNEEFFKQFGDEVTTLEQFKEKLREDIQATKKKQSDDQLKEEAIKAVIDRNRFELPESMVGNFLDDVIADFKKKSEDVVDEDEVRKNYRAYGIRHLRWNLLLHRIAEVEDIKVEQADIDAWLQRFADNYNMTLEQAKKEVARSQQIADLKETILESKVLDHIIRNSTVEPIEAPSLQSTSD
jgi:trigger factor